MWVGWLWRAEVGEEKRGEERRWEEMCGRSWQKPCSRRRRQKEIRPVLLQSGFFLRLSCSDMIRLRHLVALTCHRRERRIIDRRLSIRTKIHDRSGLLSDGYATQRTNTMLAVRFTESAQIHGVPIEDNHPIPPDGSIHLPMVQKYHRL